MLDELWVEELREQVSKEIVYAQLLEKMDTVNDRFSAMRQALQSEQREVLDAYIELRKKMEVSVTYTAYRIGIDHGRKRK